MELSSLVASVTLRLSVWHHHQGVKGAYIKEFGFFFFFRIAVAVSSTCRGHVSNVSCQTDQNKRRLHVHPSSRHLKCHCVMLTCCLGEEAREKGTTYCSKCTLGFVCDGSADMMKLDSFRI
jgi:hypothetical protein